MSKRSERRASTAVDRRMRATGVTPRNASASEIILVEDDRELCDLISGALESTGVSVTVFNDGVEALKSLVGLPKQKRQRLALLSIDIGGIDGHTVHERLTALRPGAFMVVFMTTRGSEADQVRALRAGALDYLVKPVSMHVLIERVRGWQALIANKS